MYTNDVNEGSITNFVYDGKGYGLAQWTYHTRKKAFLNFPYAQRKSIGDLDMQVDILIKELQTEFGRLWNTLCSTHDIRTASDEVLTQFECLVDMSQ